MTEKRRFGLPVIYAIGAAAIVLFAWGATIGIGYLRATDPGLAAANALEATGLVTAQHEALGELPNSKFPTATVASRLSFEFTDRDGRERGGEDEVSAVYYEAHPVGSEVDVYYQPGNSGWAVLGSAARLASKASRLDAVLGVLMLIAGAAGTVWAANQWVMNRRGVGFL